MIGVIEVGLSDGRQVEVEDVVDGVISDGAVEGGGVKEVEGGEASDSMSTLNCDE